MNLWVWKWTKYNILKYIPSTWWKYFLINFTNMAIKLSLHNVCINIFQCHSQYHSILQPPFWYKRIIFCHIIRIFKYFMTSSMYMSSNTNDMFTHSSWNRRLHLCHPRIFHFGFNGSTCIYCSLKAFNSLWVFVTLM